MCFNIYIAKVIGTHNFLTCSHMYASWLIWSHRNWQSIIINCAWSCASHPHEIVSVVNMSITLHHWSWTSTFSEYLPYMALECFGMLICIVYPIAKPNDHTYIPWCMDSYLTCLQNSNHVSPCLQIATIEKQ